MKTFTIDPTAFLVETMHLSTLEIGAYVLLMVAQAVREKPVPGENTHIIAKVSSQMDMRPMLNEMFHVVDGGWSHPGIAKQIAQAEVFSTRAAAGAAARHGKVQVETVAVRAGTNVPLVSIAPVAQRKEQGNSTSSVAGSNPAGRSIITDFGGTENVTVPLEPTAEQRAAMDEASAREALECAAIGSQLPEDFALTGTMISEAKVKGVDDMGLLADIFDEFKRYHIARATVHPDWRAAWDKWFERKRPKKPRGAPRVQLNIGKVPPSDQQGEGADD